MPPRFALLHESLYRYARSARLGPQTIRLSPTPHTRTPITGYRLDISPAPTRLDWFFDPAGNRTARALFDGATNALRVTVALEASLAPINPFDFLLDASTAEWPFPLEPWLARQLAPYREAAPQGPLLAALIASLPQSPQATLDLLVAANGLIHQRIRYERREAPGLWDAERVLSEGRGACRDMAWLLVLVLRALGFAARFVSGYMIDAENDASDHAELHAWAEAYLPGAGWIGLDPTSGLLTAEGHIPLAAAPEPEAAAPITGTVEAVVVTPRFRISLRRIAA
ncbi:MAG: transglutaminase domain-containing protein [Alphaproteobacteria bacterium]|jgi:transglutaminase-like putative cysteine protease